MPHMLERGGGSIVNIGSMAGLMAERGFISYSLSKSALGQLTRLVAIELAPRIRVNAVFPGATETDALRGFLRWHRMCATPCTPRHRCGATEHPPTSRGRCTFFASPASSWVTGKLLEVDGAAPPGLFPAEHPDL